MLAEQSPTSRIRSDANVTPRKQFAKLLLANAVASTILAASTRALTTFKLQAVLQSYQYDQQGIAKALVTPVKQTDVTREEEE
eukprot:4949844-Amphidinium_carterae.1